MKVFKVTIISIVTLILLTVGGFYMNQELERQYMLEVARSEEAHDIYRKELTHIDKNAFTSEGFIKNYSVSENEIEKNPMGGIMVVLYVNGNLSYDITVFINKNSETLKLESSGATWSPILDANINKGSEQ